MTNTSNERAYLISLYPGKKWKKRVDKMSDSQVLAIYIQKKRGEQTLKKEEKPDAEPF